MDFNYPKIEKLKSKKTIDSLFTEGKSVGKYPLRYIGLILGVGLVSALFFILIAKKFPEAFPNRVDTWISRIDNFMGDKPDEDI